VFLILDETRKLLNTAKLPRDVVVFWSLAYNLRIGALTAPQMGDISARNGGGSGALTVRGKGNKARTVPICPEAHSAISSYISDRVVGPVLRVLDGSRPMTRRAIQDRFMNLAERAGIPAEKHFPNCMPDGFATRMLCETKTIGGIYTVSKLLGIAAWPPLYTRWGGCIVVGRR